MKESNNRNIHLLYYLALFMVQVFSASFYTPESGNIVLIIKFMHPSKSRPGEYSMCHVPLCPAPWIPPAERLRTCLSHPLSAFNMESCFLLESLVLDPNEGSLPPFPNPHPNEE